MNTDSFKFLFVELATSNCWNGGFSPASSYSFDHRCNCELCVLVDDLHVSGPFIHVISLHKMNKKANYSERSDFNTRQSTRPCSL